MNALRRPTRSALRQVRTPLAGCQGSSRGLSSGVTSVTIAIEGMSCAHCLNAVNRAIAAVPGVAVTSVEIGRAVIDCQEGTDLDGAIAALAEVGYRATPVP